jgi:hypothetical protein
MESSAGEIVKLLVVPPMKDMSKGNGHTKCSPYSSRSEAGCGVDDPTPEETYCYKTMKVKTHTVTISTTEHIQHLKFPFLFFK